MATASSPIRIAPRLGQRSPHSPTWREEPPAPAFQVQFESTAARIDTEAEAFEAAAGGVGVVE